MWAWICWGILYDVSTLALHTVLVKSWHCYCMSVICWSIVNYCLLTLIVCNSVCSLLQKTQWCHLRRLWKQEVKAWRRMSLLGQSGADCRSVSLHYITVHYSKNLICLLLINTILTIYRKGLHLKIIHLIDVETFHWTPKMLTSLWSLKKSQRINKFILRAVLVWWIL